MGDPFLAGLLAGGIVGLSGIASPLLRIAAVLAAGALAWVIATYGVSGLQDMASEIVTYANSDYGRMAGGALVGVILGGPFVRALKGKNR